MSSPRSTLAAAAQSPPRRDGKLLALIPARKGSKGIPQKALQTAGGVPLVLHTIRTVLEAGVAARLVVSTDCPQTAGFCRLRGVEVLDRPDELAADDVPLAPVVKHAVDELDWQAPVAVFQPTCPMLTAETTRKVVTEFQDRGLGWAITGSAEPHLFWRDGAPLTERVNRQRAKGLIRESGAIQMFNRTGIGQAVIPIDPLEAWDIDTPADLQAARRYLDARTIRFHVVAGQRIGSGHYWRCLQLADQLQIAGHTIQWVWEPGTSLDWAKETIQGRGWIDDTQRADLHIYDVLDAGRRVLADQAEGRKVIVFEDHGPAAQWADLAINEMVDGPRWAVLRPEFTCLPDYEALPAAGRVLITFGGTDPAGLNAVVQRTFADHAAVTTRTVTPFTNAHMAQEMLAADLVVTGQGRTVFEAAACGVPCLSIAANEREARHVRMPGVIYTGLHALMSDDQIRQITLRVLADLDLREEMSATARGQIDGKGLDRILHAVDGLLKGL